MRIYFLIVVVEWVQRKRIIFIQNSVKRSQHKSLGMLLTVLVNALYVLPLHVTSLPPDSHFL